MPHSPDQQSSIIFLLYFTLASRDPMCYWFHNCPYHWGKKRLVQQGFHAVLFLAVLLQYLSSQCCIIHLNYVKLHWLLAIASVLSLLNAWWVFISTLASYFAHFFLYLWHLSYFWSFPPCFLWFYCRFHLLLPFICLHLYLILLLQILICIHFFFLVFLSIFLFGFLIHLSFIDLLVSTKSVHSHPNSVFCILFFYFHGCLLACFFLPPYCNYIFHSFSNLLFFPFSKLFWFVFFNRGVSIFFFFLFWYNSFVFLLFLIFAVFFSFFDSFIHHPISFSFWPFCCYPFYSWPVYISSSF